MAGKTGHKMPTRRNNNKRKSLMSAAEEATQALNETYLYEAPVKEEGMKIG